MRVRCSQRISEMRVESRSDRIRITLTLIEANELADILGRVEDDLDYEGEQIPDWFTPLKDGLDSLIGEANK
jgi:hypothetical protein